MRQIATVTKLIGNGLAEVVVARETACGHDCENCGGCGAAGGSVYVRARAEIPVVPGDKVEIYSDNRVLGFAAMVYLVPVIWFFIGYLAVPHLEEWLRYLCGGAGFAFGIAAAVILDRLMRKKSAVSYLITRKIF